MIELCVLASSSSGNCIYVASGSTRILVDAGLSARQTSLRLAELGTGLDEIDALCLTHEHSDHMAGFGVITRKSGMNVYANQGTMEAIESSKRREEGVKWNIITTGSAFQVGDLRLTPFGVPHDSAEPVGYIIEDSEARVGVATDLGMPTSSIRGRLSNCHALVIECNHDTHMLRNSPRPWSLKQRILGRQGHLSNEQAAELLCDVAGESLNDVILAHLSGECNDPDMALHCVKKALLKNGTEHVSVHLSFRSHISTVVRVPASVLPTASSDEITDLRETIHA